jgi:hypothetical protein
VVERVFAITVESPPDAVKAAGRDVAATANCAAAASSALSMAVDERVIEREEVVALLFAVNDISATLTRIETLLEDENGEAEAD